MKYKADIGYWEHGKSLNINANNTQEAYKLSAKELQSVKMDEKLGEPYVVEIFDEKGKVVYDYMNLFFTETEKEILEEIQDDSDFCGEFLGMNRKL